MALLGMSGLIEAAACERKPILTESMTSAVLARSRFWYQLLVQICSGKALAIIRLVTSQNSFEAWRQLEAEFAPVEPSRAVAMLAGFLTLRWDAARPFMEQLLVWERQVLAYEVLTMAPLGSATMCAVVLRRAPPAIREFLRTASQDLLGSYDQLKQAISTYLSRGRVFDATGTATGAMELDYFARGKGKGKGKEQERRRDRPQDQQPARKLAMPTREQRQVKCLNCGGNHWARGCPYPRVPRSGGGAASGGGGTAQPGPGAGRLAWQTKQRGAPGAKGGGKGKAFTGQRWRCHRVGHSATECRASTMPADLEGVVEGWTVEEQQEQQPLLMMIELEEKDVVMMETASLDMVSLARLQQCFDE